jgi:hypothetical protein
VDGLRARYFYLDELPPDAIRSYYADYYQAEVVNGGISQFVYNSRWDPVTFESVSAALDAMGLADQAALFNEVRHFVERDRPRLEAFLAGQYASPATLPYMDELEKIGGDFCARFAAHPGGHDPGICQIPVASAAWISSWPNVTWVSEEAFEQRLDDLAAVIPDLAERKRRARGGRRGRQGTQLQADTRITGLPQS